ncbi:DoxX family protein [Arthrobacter oryzae]|uniref:DoxX family protein n=1 Tax=Arthrobacter oryzae TaxID=409290 RepID=UPI0037BE5269
MRAPASPRTTNHPPSSKRGNTNVHCSIHPQCPLLGRARLLRNRQDPQRPTPDSRPGACESDQSGTTARHTLELAAAAGLLAGLAFWPIGIAAGIGAVLYFAGAIVAHLRVGDRAVTSSAVLLGISVTAVVLRALTL